MHFSSRPLAVVRSHPSFALLLASSFLPLVSCSDPGADAGVDSIGTGGASIGGSGGAVSGSGGAATNTGGTATGGSAAGGTGGTGGSAAGGTGGAETCPLPTSFEWTSSGPLAQPKSPSGANWVSLKDFTVTRHDDQYLVYATVFNAVPVGQPNRGWQGVFLEFDDFAEMGAAAQTFKGGMVAPHLMYFTPKNLWVLTYQWGFKYATSTDPSNPGSWSPTSNLLGNDPTVGGPEGTGPIDQTVICDDSDCYLFFAGDNGVIYRGSMPIDDFPGVFSNAQAIMTDEKFKLFEGVEVYKVKGAEKYLMIVEAGDGGPRYFRAFTADSLDGEWTAMPSGSTRATPFAGLENVTFDGAAWTSDISHGDVVRDDPSEKKEIDMCDLKFLYQGRDPSVNVDYGELPYRPGLLTLVR